MKKFTSIFLLLLLLVSEQLMTYSQVPGVEEYYCIKPIVDEEYSFTIRKRMVRAAKEEIIISYYAIVEAEKPFYLLAMLKQAADRGVKVRLMIDDMNTDLSESVLRYLQEMNVDVGSFNPVRLNRILRMDRRMHDKLIVIDRKYLLIGGRNISKKYFSGNLETKESFYDIDGLVKGYAAEEAAQYFDLRWKSWWVEKKKNKPKKFNPEFYEVLKVKTVEEMNILSQDTTTFDLETLFNEECHSTRFVANDPMKIRRNRIVEDEYIHAINEARDSILLQNAYVLFTHRMKKAIKHAIHRGVKVQVIANSMQSIDVRLVYAAYLNLRSQLLDMGVEVYEWQHKQTMHSKLAVIDNKVAIVGSFNLDPRSAYRNSETIIVSQDKSAVIAMNNYFQKSKGLATRIESNGKPENSEEKYPCMTKWDVTKVQLMRYTIAPLIRTFL